MTWRDHLRALLRRLFTRPSAPTPPMKQILVVTRRPPPEVCQWCKEPFDGNRHPYLRTMHIECAVRSVAGPIAHLEKRCGCYIPGSTEHDPPDLTPRQAALEVFRRVRERDHGPAN